jgi:hypothetical protein
MADFRIVKNTSHEANQLLVFLQHDRATHLLRLIANFMKPFLAGKG